MNEDNEDHLALLVGDIRRRMAELKADAAQPAVAKSQPTAEQLHQRNGRILAKALEMFHAGELTVTDIARLQAFRQMVESTDNV
jgi:hypothetical protein